MRINFHIKKTTLASAFVIFVLPLSALAATWTPPTQAPTGGNAEGPINESYTEQTKQGNLMLRGLIDAVSTYAYGLLVENGNVGIGTLNPASKLHVNGTTTTSGLAVTGGSPSMGKILSAIDGAGNVGWASGGPSNVALFIGPVVKYQNKVLIQGAAGADSNCPINYSAVGFNLYNAGSSFSQLGDLYCRRILLVTPGTPSPSGGMVLPIVSDPETTLTFTVPSTVTYYDDNGFADFTISWSSNAASSCTASGSWSGTKATSGSETIHLTSVNTNIVRTYSIVCGSAWDSVTVRINYVPPNNN